MIAAGKTLARICAEVDATTYYFLMFYDQGRITLWRKLPAGKLVSVINSDGSFEGTLLSNNASWGDPNTRIEPIDPETCAAIDMLRVHGCTQRIRDLVGDPWRDVDS